MCPNLIIQATLGAEIVLPAYKYPYPCALLLPVHVQHLPRWGTCDGVGPSLFTLSQNLDWTLKPCGSVGSCAGLFRIYQALFDCAALLAAHTAQGQIFLTDENIRNSLQPQVNILLYRVTTLKFVLLFIRQRHIGLLRRRRSYPRCRPLSSVAQF